MKSRALRGLLALGVLMALVIGTVAPAYAGTLTSASFTASTPYTYTSAANTRYDYGFTTATPSTLSKVTMSVPAGTGGSNRYLYTPGTGSNRAITSSSVLNSLTGDMEVRAKLSTAWTGTGGCLVTKSFPDNDFQACLNGTGTLSFGYSTDGTTFGYGTSSASVSPVLASQPVAWLRWVFQQNNGAGAHGISFYTSLDGTTWTQLGSTVASGDTSALFGGNASLVVGNSSNTASFYKVQVLQGINGPVVANFDPGQDSASAPSSWVSSTGETWTIDRSGSVPHADIQTDLVASGIVGLPQGGTANYRFIDGVATYNFTPTSIPSGTPCTVSLQGFTNTVTPGSYTSTINTWNNSGPPPAIVDSVTTTALVFTTDSSNTTASVTIDPSFTFTVANQSTACNGESNFISGAGSASAIALGHISSGSNLSGGQALSVASNAGGGFSIYMRGTQSSQNLRSSGHNWTDVTGSYASPAALGAGERFGYTYHDATTSSSVTNPASANFAALTATNQAVMGSTTSPSGSGCVSFDAQTAASTPAASYSATVIYVAVPSF